MVSILRDVPPRPGSRMKDGSAAWGPWAALTRGARASREVSWCMLGLGAGGASREDVKGECLLVQGQLPVQ